MDSTRFDRLARGVGAQRTRRQALAGLAAGLFGLGIAREADAQVGAEQATCGQSCRRSSDCNAGLRCYRQGGGSGTCIALRNSNDSCSNNGNCNKNYEVCINRKCVNQVQCGIDRCTRDSDCPNGEVCRQNRCERAGKRCKRNNDCANNETCRSGRCQKIECNKDSQCGRNEICLNRVCVQGGVRCNTNDQCPNNEKCRRHRCKPRG